MKYSQIFGKTKKNVPSDAVSINHKLLLQAGFIDQLSAGIFTYLPLGLRVLRKIENIVREELNSIGANEVLMPSLIQKSNFDKSDRWNSVDVLFKTKSQTDKEYGLGFSHEEVVTPLAGQFIQSYKDLPMAIYQIQTKFRDELRAKSGLLRGREFGMKDLYSFHVSQEDFAKYYELVKNTYLKIFSRMGLTQVKITEASGGSFTKKFSHEFNILTQAGEVDLIYCDKCNFAQNVEIVTKTVDKCPLCKSGIINTGKAVEIGNIFDLGTRFSEDFHIQFIDQTGQKQYPLMGCYGIGTTRLVGAIVEKYFDEKGICWPKEVAPFDCHLISLPGGEEFAQNVYQSLIKKGFEVLWDDRNIGAGAKFMDSDLIGVPVRLVVSSRTGDQIEMKLRKDTTNKIVSLSDLLKMAV